LIKYESGKWYPVDSTSWFVCYDGKENIHSWVWTIHFQ
jgi:hypothetical protein